MIRKQVVSARTGALRDNGGEGCDVIGPDPVIVDIVATKI